MYFSGLVLQSFMCVQFYIPSTVNDTMKGRDATQKDLDRFEVWTSENLMKFNKAKSKFLHLSQGNPKHKHRLRREWMEKRLGLLIDKKFNVSLILDDRPTMWLTTQKAK